MIRGKISAHLRNESKARSNVRALVSAHNQHGALCVTHYSCGVRTEQISGDIRSMGSNDDHMSGDLLRQFQNAVFGRAFLNMDMHSVGWQFKFLMISSSCDLASAFRSSIAGNSAEYAKPREA